MSTELPVEVAEAAEQWAQARYERLTASGGASHSIIDVLEELRPFIYDAGDEQREAGLERMVVLLLKLPNDLLTEDQVQLLLAFLTKQLDLSGLAATDVLQAIRHLAIESANGSAEAAKIVFRNLFQDGNVQAWSVSQRLVMYELLDWLANHHRAAMLPHSSEFVLAFTRAMSGERDPRCLSQAFRIFRDIAQGFSLGPFVEEMFEIVACYWPIQFKPRREDNLTREQLALACEQCLLAHAGFAPFCYLMIEEKLTEEESDGAAKHEACVLLARAASVFPARALVPLADTLLAGIRSASFDPADKEAANAEVARDALTAMSARFSELGTKQLEAAVKNMMENIEPFVLQAEMGLSLRAFSLLECFYPAGGPDEKKDLEQDTVLQLTASRIIAWAVTLVQGRTINTAANRADVAKDGLSALSRWVALAARMNFQGVFLEQEESIFGSLDEVRSVVPKEAACTAYECAKVFLCLPAVGSQNEDKNTVASAESTEGGKVDRDTRFADMARRGFYEFGDEQENEKFLEYISEFARHQWKTHSRILAEAIPIEGENERFAGKRLATLCASVYNDETWQCLKQRIFEEIYELGEKGCAQLLRLIEKGDILGIGRSRLAQEFLDFLLGLKGAALASLSVHSEIALRLASSMTEREISDVATRLLGEWKRGIDAPVADLERTVHQMRLLLLLIAQAQDDALALIANTFSSIASALPARPELFPHVLHEFNELVPQAYFIIVNRLGDESESAKILEKAATGRVEELKVMRTKALLISGNAMGLEDVKKLLNDSIKSESDSQETRDRLESLLDFSTALFDTEANRLKNTVLWRQRVTYQVAPLFLEAMTSSSSLSHSAPSSSRLALLSSLRHLIALQPTAHDSSNVLAPFLNVFVDVLFTEATRGSLNGSGDIQAPPSASSPLTQGCPFLLESLRALIERAEKEQLSKALVAKMAEALCRVVEDLTSETSDIQSCISTLRALTARAPPTSCQPSITRVVRALATATGHRKRVVRQSAADVRNRWELLSTI